jgi:hypothetical protein
MPTGPATAAVGLLIPPTRPDDEAKLIGDPESQNVFDIGLAAVPWN